MLTIRLSRVGKKNKPMYRLIISEKARDPYGRALEILGSYNPHTKELNAKNERIKYWISKGSQISPTVNNLLIEKGIIDGEKVKASKARKKKKDKEKTKSETPKKEDQKEKAEAKVPSDAEAVVGKEEKGEKNPPSGEEKVEENKADANEKPKEEVKTEKEEVKK